MAVCSKCQIHEAADCACDACGGLCEHCIRRKVFETAKVLTGELADLSEDTISGLASYAASIFKQLKEGKTVILEPIAVHAVLVKTAFVGASKVLAEKVG